VTLSIVRQRPAPATCDASSSAGSIDFITAPIITNATEPSNNAMAQAMPIADVMSTSAPCPPIARQIWLMNPLSGAPRKFQASAPSRGVT
jgi:hypothetical protein